MSLTSLPGDDLPVIVEISGALGIIRLNRPKALNSLTHSMVALIDRALDRFEADPAVGQVLIEATGERAFCAGGDIRALYDRGKAGDLEEAGLFWREEYILNARIAGFPKPYIAFMDGITMGGGVGVSAHGSHRIVTERTKIAMPEVGIGFVPDVGGTWLLTRKPGGIGAYLALTGETIGAADAIAASLADRIVAAADLPALRTALAQADPAALEPVFDRFALALPIGPVEQHRAVIDRTLGRGPIAAILDALDGDGSDFAAATARTIRAKSPTSVKLALRLLAFARGAPSLEACLVQEFRVAISTLEGHDFYEGVRAAVIDKDRNPHWSPAALDAVEDAALDACFRPRPGLEPEF
jgi:enoyl-CoA hydratase